MDVGGEDVPAGVGFGALTAFDVATGGPAELRYETSTSRRAGAVRPGRAVGRRPRRGESAATSRRGPRRAAARGDRRAVIDLAEDVDLPTDAGDVPVMVPLEPVGAGARQPVAPQAAAAALPCRRRGGAGCLGRRHVRRRGRPGSGRCQVRQGSAGSGRCPGVTAMILRRLPMLVVTIAALIAVVLGAGTAVVPTERRVLHRQRPVDAGSPAARWAHELVVLSRSTGRRRGGPHRERHRVQLRRRRRCAAGSRCCVSTASRSPRTSRCHRSDSLDVRLDELVESPVRRGVRRDRRRGRARRAARRRSGRASRSPPAPTPAPRSGTSPPATRSTAASSDSCCPTPTTTRRSSTSPWPPSAGSGSPRSIRASPSPPSPCG